MKISGKYPSKGSPTAEIKSKHRQQSKPMSQHTFAFTSFLPAPLVSSFQMWPYHVVQYVPNSDISFHGLASALPCFNPCSVASNSVGFPHQCQDRTLVANSIQMVQAARAQTIVAHQDTCTIRLVPTVPKPSPEDFDNVLCSEFPPDFAQATEPQDKSDPAQRSCAHDLINSVQSSFLNAGSGPSTPVRPNKYVEKLRVEVSNSPPPVKLRGTPPEGKIYIPPRKSLP